MELIERDQGVTGLDDTNKLFIIITKNYQEFSLWDRLHPSCTKDSKFIGTSFDLSEEVGDTLKTLSGIFAVAFDLFNAFLGWLGINVGKDGPSIMWGMGASNKWKVVGEREPMSAFKIN